MDDALIDREQKTQTERSRTPSIRLRPTQPHNNLHQFQRSHGSATGLIAGPAFFCASASQRQAHRDEPDRAARQVAQGDAKLEHERGYISEML